MTWDDELVECVGRDKVVEICKQLGCTRYDTCVPHNAGADLCVECYTKVMGKYPECGRSV